MSNHPRSRGRSINPRITSVGSSIPSSPSFFQRIKPVRSFRVTHDDRKAKIMSLARTLSREEIVSPPEVGDDSFRSKRFNILLNSRRRTNSVNTVLSEESDNNNNCKTFVDASSDGIDNVMQWMEKLCPVDILPKILSFVGPQTMSSLSKTSRKWNTLIKQEGTWRVVCEEQYKWKEGDEVPESWLDYYRLNPCVPVDYSTVHKAITSTSMECYRRRAVRKIRVFIRPGKHYLRQSVIIRLIPGCEISVETMAVPRDTFRPLRPKEVREQSIPTSMVTSTKKVKKGLRDWMGCTRPEVVEHSETEECSDNIEDWSDPRSSLPTSATLILSSRNHNEPIFRVQQGFLKIKNIDLQHQSHGVDIWNGNAAVHVQPPLTNDDRPMLVYPLPSASLEGVQVWSKSGRGIVVMDGGKLIIRDSMVRDCAATGIYVGGDGSQAVIEQTDVVRNGIGNLYTFGGIAAGHSGIYLEQGVVDVVECNVSRNTLTGISVVSHDNATITIKDSDLVSNGSQQLELPALGSTSRRRCFTSNVNTAISGEGRLRSSLNYANF